MKNSVGPRTAGTPTEQRWDAAVDTEKHLFDTWTNLRRDQYCYSPKMRLEKTLVLRLVYLWLLKSLREPQKICLHAHFYPILWKCYLKFSFNCSWFSFSTWFTWTVSIQTIISMVSVLMFGFVSLSQSRPSTGNEKTRPVPVLRLDCQSTEEAA